MFDEAKRAIGAEHTTRLGESRCGIRDTAQRPGDDHRVDAAIRDGRRDMLGGAFQQLHSQTAALGLEHGRTVRHGEQFG